MPSTGWYTDSTNALQMVWEEVKQSGIGEPRSFFFKKKQIIFQEGFKVVGLFCIRKGKVKLYKAVSSGKEVIIYIANEGDMLDYSALIGKSEHTCWGCATEDTEICFFSKKMFFQLIESNPLLSLRLMQLFVMKYNMVIDKLADVASNNVRKRTAETLLSLMQTYGLESDKKTINLVLSRDDLAHLVVTNTETLVRTLSEFKKQKAIEVKGKRISILNPQLLFMETALV